MVNAQRDPPKGKAAMEQMANSERGLVLVEHPVTEEVFEEEDVYDFGEDEETIQLQSKWLAIA